MKIELKSTKKYKNKKTGKIYILLREIFDATNGREGKTVVLYIEPVQLRMYVRDATEFLEKFEVI